MDGVGCLPAQAPGQVKVQEKIKELSCAIGDLELVVTELLNRIDPVCSYNLPPQDCAEVPALSHHHIREMIANELSRVLEIKVKVQRIIDGLHV